MFENIINPQLKDSKLTNYNKTNNSILSKNANRKFLWHSSGRLNIASEAINRNAGDLEKSSRNALKTFEHHFKIQGVGVKLAKKITRFYKEEYKEVKMVRFCEAVCLARESPIILKKKNISCPGARFAFGVAEENPGMVKKGLMEERAMNGDAAEKLIKNIQRLSQVYKWIILGDKDSQIYIFFFNPKKFMEFLILYQMAGEPLAITLSSIMTMCGDLAVRSFTSGKTTVSFGCQNSRQYGGIKDDELIVCLPANEVERLALQINNANQINHVNKSTKSTTVK